MGTSTVSKDKRSKAIRSALAVALALLLALGGTFAWTSVSQLALNKSSDDPNPGARLHDSFAGIGHGDKYAGESAARSANKDIFVENYSDSATVYARVKLYEYLRIGEKPVGKAGAVEETYTTWASPYAEADGDATEAIRKYWTLNMGPEAETDTWYVPTFNKSNLSLAADVRGEDASTDAEKEAAGKARAYYTQDQLKDGGEKHDVTDEREWHDNGGTTSEDADPTTHTAELLDVKATRIVSMSEWAADPQPDAWVYDPSDGWLYWSSPLDGGRTTSLLLDSVQMTDITPNSEWTYLVRAEGQFATDEEWGMDGAQPRFDADDETDATKMSAEALAMLNRIADKTTYSVSVAAANGATQAPQGSTLASIATVEEGSGGSESASSAVVTYTLADSGAQDPGTSIDAATGLLTVGSGEAVGNTLTVTATVAEQPSAKATYSVTVVAPDWKLALKNALTANESYERYGSSDASLVDIKGVSYNKLAVDTDGSALVLTRKPASNWGTDGKGVFDANSPAWEGSDAQAWCNGTYFNSLDPEVQNAIGEGRKTTTQTVNTNPGTSTTANPDKAFFLSEADVFGSMSNGDTSTPTTLRNYYSWGNKPLVPTDIMTATNSAGQPIRWWLRSPCYSSGVTTVAPGGSLNYYGYNQSSLSARPAFWVNLGSA